MDERKRRAAIAMLKDPDNTVGEVAQSVRVSPATLYRHLGAVKPDRYGYNKGGG